MVGPSEIEIEMPSLEEYRDIHLGETVFFWHYRGKTSNPDSIQDMEPDMEERGGGVRVTFTGMHFLEDHSPHSNNLGNSSAQAGVARSPTHSVHLYEKQPYVDTDFFLDVAPMVYASSFVHGTSTALDPSESELAYSVKPPPVAISLQSPVTHGRGVSFGENNNISPLNLGSAGAFVPPELATLFHQEFGNESSRSTELLTAIASTLQGAVREHGPSGMSLPIISSNGDEEEEAPEQDHILRAAICDHPLYPEMVLAHIGILKIGASSELLVKLEDVTRNFVRFYKGGHTSKLGHLDPELDSCMESYVDMLTNFRDDLEEPFNNCLQLMYKTTKDLEALCGHSVEIKPEAEDNYGFEILAEGINLMQFTHATNIDGSIVEEELDKKVLKMKYGRHIKELKAELSKHAEREKARTLPKDARKILKDWFNQHSDSPYPSRVEKADMQQRSNLSLTQINNWFVNQRKRHPKRHWRGEKKKNIQ